MNLEKLITQAPEVRIADAWPEPEPLDDLEGPPVPAFDAPALLPEPLGPWAEDVADRMNAPVEFLATAALVALAGVVGNRVLVAPDPEANPEWLEAPNLWGLLVGEPGTKKSPAMERAFAPLHDLEAALHQENVERRNRWELARRNRKGEFTADDLRPPPEKALLTHDITPEKLGELLEQNPYGLVAYQDELLGLIASWERPDRGGERQFYLKLWNGLSAHTIRRIQRGSHFIPVCTLSLIGGAQPGPLARYILEAARGWNDDGLLQRFQLLIRAELPPYHRAVRPPSRWEKKYRELFTVLPGALSGRALPVVSLRPGVERPVARFDPEAQEIFLEWLEATAQESRRPTTQALKRSLLEKQAGLPPKLALLLEAVELRGTLCDRGVGTTSVLRAITLADLYRDHALAVWAAALKPELEGALILAKRIRARVKTKSAFDYERITARGILRAGWKGLSDPRTIESALSELEARGWLRREGGVWKPNPRIWE